MKIMNVNSPHAVAPTNTNVQKANEAREKAIAKITGAPVPQNQNAVAPEETVVMQPNVPIPNIQKPSNVATPAPEAPAQVEPPAPPDAQLLTLIRREKQLRIQAQKQQDAFKTREAELVKRQAELDAKQRELDNGYIAKQRLKDNTLEVLAEQEISYDEITQQQLQVQNVSPQVKVLLNKLAEQNKLLTDKVEKLTSDQASSHEESTQAALKQIARDAKQLITKDTADQYGFIKHYGQAGIKTVVDLIQAEFNETGEQMSVEDALQQVEQEYTERFEKMNTIKKVQAKQQGAVNTAQQPAEQPRAPNQQQQTMKTLTNDAGSTRQLSAKERAVLAFEGKLTR